MHVGQDIMSELVWEGDAPGEEVCTGMERKKKSHLPTLSSSLLHSVLWDWLCLWLACIWNTWSKAKQGTMSYDLPWQSPSCLSKVSASTSLLWRFPPRDPAGYPQSVSWLSPCQKMVWGSQQKGAHRWSRSHFVVPHVNPVVELAGSPPELVAMLCPRKWLFPQFWYWIAAPPQRLRRTSTSSSL